MHSVLTWTTLWAGIYYAQKMTGNTHIAEMRLTRQVQHLTCGPHSADCDHAILGTLTPSLLVRYTTNTILIRYNTNTILIRYHTTTGLTPDS